MVTLYSFLAKNPRIGPNLSFFSQINITRFPTPYTSKCVSDWSGTNYSAFLPWDDFYYTLSQCQRFCLQGAIA